MTASPPTDRWLNAKAPSLDELVDDELHAHFNEVLGGMGAFLMGRVTYEGMEEVWPTADQDPESTPPMVEFTDIDPPK